MALCFTADKNMVFLFLLAREIRAPNFTQTSFTSHDSSLKLRKRFFNVVFNLERF